MLNIDHLENVQQKHGKLTTRCPACALEGHDKSGNHLVVYPDGRYGCVAHLGDTSHRQEIFRLVGEPGNLMHTPVPRLTSLKEAPLRKLIRTVNLNHRPRLPRQKSSPHEKSDKKQETPPRLPHQISIENQKKQKFSNKTETQTGTSAGQVKNCRGNRGDTQEVLSGVIDIFDAKVVAELTPEQPIPTDFLDVLRTWPEVLNHRAWVDHSQLRSPDQVQDGVHHKPISSSRLENTDRVAEDIVAWNRVAEEILGGNFAIPAELSLINAWKIGLRGVATVKTKAALSKLDSVKPNRC